MRRRRGSLFAVAAGVLGLRLVLGNGSAASAGSPLLLAAWALLFAGGVGLLSLDVEDHLAPPVVPAPPPVAKATLRP